MRSDPYKHLRMLLLQELLLLYSPQCKGPKHGSLIDDSSGGYGGVKEVHEPLPQCGALLPIDILPAACAGRLEAPFESLLV